MELSTLSLEALKKLKRDVEKAIDSFEQRKRKEALLAIEEKAKEMGFSLSELTGAAPIKKVSKVAPKYANPQDPSQTWTGRGRKPKWVEAALASGKSLDDLVI